MMSRVLGVESNGFGAAMFQAKAGNIRIAIQTMEPFEERSSGRLDKCDHIGDVLRR